MWLSINTSIAFIWSCKFGSVFESLFAEISIFKFSIKTLNFSLELEKFLLITLPSISLLGSNIAFRSNACKDLR